MQHVRVLAGQFKQARWFFSWQLIGMALLASALIPILISQAAGGEAAAKPEVQVMAPGWGELRFEAPAPGTYALPPIKLAADGAVVFPDGSKKNLHDLFSSNKLTILNFIYTSCDDVNGCPLATFVLHSVKQRLQKQPDLASRIQLITISFDPVNDTPEVMKAYGEEFQGGHLQWVFGTLDAKNVELPMRETLFHYGQSVLRQQENGKNRVVAHMLKAFLIDKRGMIRNIYGVDFLHPDVLIADARTLLLEEQTLLTQ